MKKLMENPLFLIVGLIAGTVLIWKRNLDLKKDKN